jgi:murein DD-endopeptidase MepM/ murein hydrolase activator NlpD
MADEKIVFKVVVDDEGNIVKLQSTEKGFRDIDLTVKNAENSAKKLNQTISKTGSGGTLKSLKLTQKEYGKLVKTQHQISDATGSATSATMELSRVISDAPYGIRGMANNITQLVSQLGTASTKAGGLSSALKLMGKQLMGPLGIVFAITAAISALDFFFGANEKAQKSVSDLTKEVYSSGLVANQYAKELEDVNLTEERRKVVTQELIKLIPTLSEEDLKYGNSLDDIRLKIKQYTLAQAGRVEMDKLVQENSALLSKQMRVDLVNSTEDQEEKVKIIKGLLKEEGIELEKAVNQSYQMGQANLTLRKKTNDELIQDFNILAKGIKKESDPILEQINNISDALILDPEKNGKKPTGKDRPLVKWFYNEMAGLADIIKDENFDDISDTANITGELILPAKVTPFMPDEDELLQFIERYNVVMSGLTDFVDGEFERQLTIEQNKTNALNEELNNRLLNESLSADQRKSIQNEIAQNDERLRVKQEAIKKKAFNTQKAFNISTALLDTYSAASSVFKNTLANPINKLLPDGGLLKAKINAGVAIAGGLLQVAAISRQKYQSSSAATPINTTGGGGAGASQRADPSFNIVGRSGDNLLINAIQAQFDKPLKAYVVSRDVTNQQQLDGMIVSQAGT